MVSPSDSLRSEAFVAMLRDLLPELRRQILRRAPGWSPPTAGDAPRPLRSLLEAELDGVDPTPAGAVDGVTLPIGSGDAMQFWLRRRWLERARRRRDLLSRLPGDWARLAMLGVVAARELCADLGAQAAALGVARALERNLTLGFTTAAAAWVRRAAARRSDQADRRPSEELRALAPIVRAEIARWPTQPADESLLQLLGVRCLATLQRQLDRPQRRTLRQVIDEHFARSSVLESAASGTLFESAGPVTHVTLRRWFEETLTTRGTRTNL